MSKHIKYMIRAQCCQPVCEIVFNFIQFPQLFPPSFPLFSMFFPSFWDDERKLHDIAFLGIRFKDFLLLFFFFSVYVCSNVVVIRICIYIRPHQQDQLLEHSSIFYSFPLLFATSKNSWDARIVVVILHTAIRIHVRLFI